jgi:hypothetical protein
MIKPFCQWRRQLAIGGTLLLLNVAVYAHHGWSEYDQTKTVKLTGKITQSGYEHPHGVIKLNADGKSWTVVLAPPFRMENRGLSKNDIANGSQVTVEGYINRSQPDELRAERITAGSKTVELR